MEKKNTSPTVAEQKQILETCVHKLEEVNACILAMYPTLSTNLPLSDYTNEELIAQNAVHQVEIITLDGHYVAYITYHSTFVTDRKSVV